MTRQH